VFPIYHVFSEMAGFNRVCPTHSTHPLQGEVLTLLDARNQKRMLIANLLPENQEIKIKTGTCDARVKRLNAETVEEAMRAPEKFRAEVGAETKSVSGKIELLLAPYEIARVDILQP